MAMSTETKKLLIFDMDGVVLDSEPLHENARQRMFRELGITPDDRLPAPVGKSASGFWRNVLEICGMEGDPYGLERRQYALVAQQIEEHHLRPSDGFEEVVQEAKRAGMKIALASSSTRVLVDDALRLLGVRDYFDVTVSGDEIARKKPAPDVYLRVLELTGTAARDALAVEDSQAGVASAQEAGIYCYGYSNPTSGEQDISAADRVILSLRQIGI